MISIYPYLYPSKAFIVFCPQHCWLFADAASGSCFNDSSWGGAGVSFYCSTQTGEDHRYVRTAQVTRNVLVRSEDHERPRTWCFDVFLLKMFQVDFEPLIVAIEIVSVPIKNDSCPYLYKRLPGWVYGSYRSHGFPLGHRQREILCQCRGAMAGFRGVNTSVRCILNSPEWGYIIYIYISMYNICIYIYLYIYIYMTCIRFQMCQ